MLPKLIIHNSITLNGAFTNFDVNMQLHYQIAASFQADMILVGSETAKTGIEMFHQGLPPETEKDFKKPNKNGALWAILDSTGKLKGKLHVLRQSEYCKDIIILISKKTPKEYLDYLKKRDYDFYILGDSKCDLKKSLETLKEKYNAKTIITDAGPTLGNLLLDQDLASQISLLVHPQITKDKKNIFSNVHKPIKLKLIKRETLENEFVWLLYQIEKTNALLRESSNKNTIVKK